MRLQLQYKYSEKPNLDHSENGAYVDVIPKRSWCKHFPTNSALNRSLFSECCRPHTGESGGTEREVWPTQPPGVQDLTWDVKKMARFKRTGTRYPHRTSNYPDVAYRNSVTPVSLELMRVEAHHPIAGVTLKTLPKRCPHQFISRGQELLFHF